MLPRGEGDDYFLTEHKNYCSAVKDFYVEIWTENISRSHRKAVCNNFIVAFKATCPISEESVININFDT